MIKIKIDTEWKRIPTASEMTVKQYISFMDNENKDIISYLSAVLNVEYKEAFYFKLKNYSLLKRIGKVEHFADLKPKKKLLLKDGSFYYIPNEIETIGQRFMIEENASKMKQEEYFCFILAVGLCVDPMDFEKVTALKEKLMNESYQDILPTAFFLLKNLLTGKSSGANFFSRLILSIKIRALKRI